MNKLILKILPQILICLVIAIDFLFVKGYISIGTIDHEVIIRDISLITFLILIPMIYIYQGIIYSKSIKEIIIGFSSSAIVLYIFLKVYASVAYTNELIIIYTLIGAITLIICTVIRLIKRVIIKVKAKK